MALTKILRQGDKVIFTSKSLRKPIFVEHNGKVGTVLFRSWGCTDKSEPAYCVQVETDKRKSGVTNILAMLSELTKVE